jgi:hypothetical protein
LAAEEFAGPSSRSITADAFAAIEATLPEGSEADGRPDGKGDYLWSRCHHGVLDRVKAIRGLGESYSDVIIRIAPPVVFVMTFSAA